MNSYFASVEQQANPKLQGKPIIVTGEGKRTIVIAASYEAKKYGVKTGMRIIDAEKLCPTLIRVYGDGEKYASLQLQILEIIERYFLSIEIASIDEFYIDCGGINDWDKLKEISLNIKKDLKEELGEYLRCSIGISINKRMSKLASNMKKPDGLTVLTESDLERVLPTLPVAEISGIGNRIEARLHALGIYTLGDIKSFPESVLLKHFKEHLTLFLIETSKGIDNTKVVAYTETPMPKSFGHEVTFSKDMIDIERLSQTLYSLTERVVFRMRKQGMKGKGISVHVRFKDMTYDGGHIGLKGYTDNTEVIYKTGLVILRELLNHGALIRQIGIRITDTIKSTDLPLELFPERDEMLLNAVQDINMKYGQFTIAPGSVYNTRSLDRKIHGFYRLDK